MTSDTNDKAPQGDWSAVEEAAELLHEERFREAMVELRRVLQADPRNAYAYYFLGVAFYEVGELDAARDAYTACLKLSPSYLGARVALSHLFRTLGDVDRALREGMTALGQSHADPDALYAVGLAYRACGEDVAATRYLEAFLATRPEFEVAVETRAMIAAMAGDNPRAEDNDEEEDD